MSKPAGEIKFPCRWEFRMIAGAAEAEKVRQQAEAIGVEENAGFEITGGGSSGGGKYLAVRVACMVDSMERAKALAGRLSKVEGVRFLI